MERQPRTLKRVCPYFFYASARSSYLLSGRSRLMKSLIFSICSWLPFFLSLSCQRAWRRPLRNGKPSAYQQAAENNVHRMYNTQPHLRGIFILRQTTENCLIWLR